MSNMAMTIKVEAPDLVAALMRLAAAVTPDPNILTPDTPRPQMPAPAPAPIAPPAPMPPVAPVASQMPTAATNQPPVMPQTPGPAPVAPAPAPAAPAVPVAGAPTYTLDQIAKAGASLMDAGKMEPLLALLSRYGVQAVTQLAPEHYGAFATELRTLGAQI
ncbi:hypothetical protein AALA83_06270 [Oscillospiraceae bacterium 44-5]